MTSNDLAPRIHALQGILAERKKQVFSLENLLKQQKNELGIILDALDICTQAQLYLQSRVEFCLSSVVTKAMSIVFPDPYEFRLNFEINQHDAVSATPVLWKHGEEYDPLFGTGGGVVDVVSFALRVACLVLSGKEDRVLILDEPAKHLSSDLHDRFKEVVDELTEQLSIQFLMVTHSDVFAESNSLVANTGDDL